MNLFSFTFLNTNARSLSPKINSLIDCFDELDVSVAAVTETWLNDAHGLEEDLDHLAAGTGLGMLTLNRKQNDRGVSHGGVAIIYHQNKCTFKQIKLCNPDSFEVLAASGKFVGYLRTVLVLACYVPPTYDTQRAGACLDFVRDSVVELKRKFDDPYIIVTGDFNQWGIQDALEDYPDIKEECLGPTRGARAIDRTFTNFSRSIKESGTLPPLEADHPGEGAPSDHRIAFFYCGLT